MAGGLAALAATDKGAPSLQAIAPLALGGCKFVLAIGVLTLAGW